MNDASQKAYPSISDKTNKTRIHGSVKETLILCFWDRTFKKVIDESNAVERPNVCGFVQT